MYNVKHRRQLLTGGLALYIAIVLEARQGCDVAACAVADAYQYNAVEGEIDVDARSELDESQVLVDVGLCSPASVCDDASCHGSGHLAHRQAASAVGEDADGGALVLGAGLGEVRRQEAPGVVLDVLDLALGRKPVGVHIERRHEDADHDGAGVEVLVLVYFLDGDYLAVDRGDDHAVPLALVVAGRAAEEVEDETIDDGGDGRADGRQPGLRGQEEPGGDVDGDEHERQEHQDVGALVVDLDFDVPVLHVRLCGYNSPQR